jgi:AcrR family transcriptional regulator
MARKRNVRENLLTAAETLFAEHGLEGVSLREIGSAAGATNTNAIQYHFGDRAGLVRALVARHDATVEARRHAVLDQLEADAALTLTTLAGALVRPLAAELSEPGGGGYLQVLSDLLNSPRPIIDWEARAGTKSSVGRWRRLIEPHMDPEAVRRHRRFGCLRFTVSELARRSATPGRRSDARFVAELVDLVEGLLSAPISRP